MDIQCTICRHNYALTANINTKGKTDSLFFQHNMTLYGSPEDMFILSLNEDDKIRLIRAPDYIIKLVGAVIRRYILEICEKCIKNCQKNKQMNEYFIF